MTAKKQTLRQFIKEVENLLMKHHGITINDCTDKEQLEREFKDGETPIDFVEWIANKHDLDRIDLEPFTLKDKK